MTDCCFNPEPIMLRNPSSLLVHEQDKMKEEQMMEIAQHLAPEQYQYEFPPKSRIMAIEAELDYESDSFFDECSFTTSSTAAYSNIIHEEDEEEEDEDYYQQLMHSNRSSSDRLDRYFDSFTNEHNKFIADHQLSPLQLPSQASYNNNMRYIREESYDSTGTVVINKKSEYSRPSSFLSANSLLEQEKKFHHLDCVAEEDRINWDEHSFIFPDHSNQFVHENVYRSVHPYHCRSQGDIFPGDDLVSLNEDDNGSHFSSSSKVIVMKISKNHPPTVIQCSTVGGSSFISTTDEGYDDEEYDGDCKELPIESASVFLPLSDGEQDQLVDMENRDVLAAIKIQSIWRGYQSRRKQQKSSMKLSHRVLAGLAHVQNSIQTRNHNQLQGRCDELEQRLGEETAMRIAFEKAMEDMTVLMDHQHKVLHERVQQEVDMRQAYERKMEQVMNQVQPLESRLRHESKARADMESMMSRILDQLHDVKVQQKEEIDQRKSLQRKLDEATKEISLLKKQPSTTPASKTIISTSQQRSISRISSTKSTNSSNSRNSSPVPIKRTVTPNNRATAATSSIRSSTRLSNRSTTDVNNKKTTTTTTTTTTTPLRKTVINRKL